MPGANCKPLRVLRVPRTPFPGHILNADAEAENADAEAGRLRLMQAEAEAEAG